MDGNYGMIVVGGGMAGLSAGLAWTKVRPDAASRVLVLERNPVVGGCVSSFSRAGYRFDSVQIVPDIADLLDFFGIDLPLVRFEPYYARLFLADPAARTSRIFEVRSSRAGFERYLRELFPAEEDRLASYFRYCSALYDELRYLKTEPGLLDIATIVLRCPKILANSEKSFRQFLARFGFRDPDLVDVLDIFSSFSGLSGDRCASLLTASAMMTTLDGAWRPASAFIRLPLALQEKLLAAGGEVRTRCAVSKVIVENGRAVGVRLENGESLGADRVVLTADTKAALSGLVGFDVLRRLDPGYERKARFARMSPSCLSIHLGLDETVDLKALGFRCGYNVLTTGRETHKRMFDAWDKGERLVDDRCFHLAVFNSSLVTGGKNNLSIDVVPAAAEDWERLRREDPAGYEAEKERVADFYIRKVEEYMIPGLRKHLAMIDVSTPATFQRWLGSPTGSNFDMLAIPGNFGKNRLRTRTPVRDLYLPKFSHGIWPALQSGLQVADMISGGAVMDGNSRYVKRPARPG